MANEFPIGPSQILAFKTLNLTIDSCDYNPRGEASVLGYKRMRVQDHWLKVKHLITGTPSISGRKHFVKYQFQWDLQLPTEKAFLAEAIYQEQKLEYDLYGANPEVRLLDTRLAFLAVANPGRERAKIGTIIPPTTPPANYEYIFPQFNIAITSFSMEPYILGTANLWQVKMRAIELEPVPITEDI